MLHTLLPFFTLKTKVFPVFEQEGQLFLLTEVTVNIRKGLTNCQNRAKDVSLFIFMLVYC